LLEGGEPMAELIGLGGSRFRGEQPGSNHQRRLEQDTCRRP
jgi:hypothetical protein